MLSLEVPESRGEDGGTNPTQSNDEATLFLNDSDLDPEQPRFSSCFNSNQVAEFGFCLVIFVGGILFEFTGVEPHQRVIPVQQLSTGEFALNQIYDQRFVGETIGILRLLLYGIIFPLLLQLLLSCSSQRPKCYHEIICVYLAAIGITLLATDAVKVYVGYLRPVFYDICVPDETYTICTSDEADEARKSFPSGHASMSFCGLGLLSFYLEKRFGVSRFRTVGPERTTANPKSLVMAKIWSVLSKTPLILAGYISTSRVVDNKHHPADVVGGATLGLSIALWIHNVWYEYS